MEATLMNTSFEEKRKEMRESCEIGGVEEGDGV